MGGPLAAGYMVAENYKAFNENRNAAITWIITVIAIIFGICIAALLSGTNGFYNRLWQLIHFIYIGLILLLNHLIHRNKIKTFIANGGKAFGWKRAFGVSLLGMTILLIPVGIETLVNKKPETNIVVNRFGSMSHEIAYDSTKISVNEIDGIASTFFLLNFFDEGKTKYTHVCKKDSIYEITISCDESVMENPAAFLLFEKLRHDMQQNFANRKIVILLVVDRLDNIVKRLE